MLDRDEASAMNVHDELNAIAARLQDLAAALKELPYDKAPELIMTRGHLVMDRSRMKVTWRGEEVRLTLSQFDFVSALARHPQHIRTRDQLANQIQTHPLDYYDERRIDSHAKRIRRKFKKVDPDFKQIVTVYGVGYCWSDDA